MTNAVPVGPIGHEFEFLVQELPYWVRETYYPSMEVIERVRKALREYEVGNQKPTNVLTKKKSVVV